MERIAKRFPPPPRRGREPYQNKPQWNQTQQGQ
jgi:hypothetical protein